LPIFQAHTGDFPGYRLWEFPFLGKTALSRKFSRKGRVELW
jgi:hypothetical protein